jgi:hypothetical protein
MKLMMKTVDMLAWFDAEGNPAPIRFRLKNPEGENIIIKIDHIFSNEFEKSAGNSMIRFDCRATVDNASRILRLKYEMGSCKWYLAQM